MPPESFLHGKAFRRHAFGSRAGLPLKTGGIFRADPDHELNSREKKAALDAKAEEWLGFQFNQRNHRPVR
jgi:hypothetical protein